MIMSDITRVMWVFDKTFNLGYKTDEPSLRKIIFKYYHPHFDAEEANNLTNQLIQKIEDYLIGDIDE